MFTRDLIHLYILASAISFVLPLIAAVRLRSLLSGVQKRMMLFCIISLLFVAAEHVLGDLGLRNHWLINLSHWVCLFFMLFVLHSATSDKRKSLIVLFAAANLLLGIYVLFVQDPFLYSTLLAMYYKAIILIASLIVIYDQIHSGMSQEFSSVIFWICAGNIIFAAGSLVVNAFADQLMHLSPEDFSKFWSIIWITAVISNLFYTKSFLVRRR